MKRSIGAVLSGAVVWTILWVASAQIVTAVVPRAITAEGRAGSDSVSLAFLVLSVIVSVAAGYLTAQIAVRRELRHAVALGILQLALGISFQVSAWDKDPVWYHLSFLALLLPGAALGGWLKQRSTRARTSEGFSVAS